jgi:hypothetical protein
MSAGERAENYWKQIQTLGIETTSSSTQEMLRFGTLAIQRVLALPLEIHITLDTDVRSVDVGSVNGHVDVGGPRSIAPLDVEAVVGSEVRR